MAGQYNYILTKNKSERNMERFELENSKEFKAAQELEDALNNMSWNSEKFAESVGYYHRTLQQKLFSTMVKVIEMMGKEDYGYDLRNEASHRIARKIVESGVLDETIPIIWCPPFFIYLKYKRLCYTINFKITKNSKTCLVLSSMETEYAAERTRYCWHM